jgi:hypothetical protein
MFCVTPFFSITIGLVDLGATSPPATRDDERRFDRGEISARSSRIGIVLARLTDSRAHTTIERGGLPT